MIKVKCAHKIVIYKANMTKISPKTLISMTLFFWIYFYLVYFLLNVNRFDCKYTVIILNISQNVIKNKYEPHKG